MKAPCISIHTSQIIGIILVGLLAFGYVSPALATSNLDVFLYSGGNSERPSFKFFETVFIEYPNGGKLKDLLAGKTFTVSFVERSDNPSVQDLIQKINTDLARDQKSPVIVTDLMVKYSATLEGDNEKASIYYNLELTPTITDYVLSKGSGDKPTIIDAAWMGLAVKDPVIIKTPQYGDYEINFPVDFLKKTAPSVYSVIAGSKAEDALKNNLIDASSILQEPLDQWVHLFDPAYTLSETSDYGYAGQIVAITTYTMGQSSLGEGIQKPTQNTIDFSADANYKLTTIQHASSATVNIDGQALATKVGDSPAFATTQKTTLLTSSMNPLSTIFFYIVLSFFIIAGLAIGIYLWKDPKNWKRK